MDCWGLEYGHWQGVVLCDLGVGQGLRRFLCGIFLLWMHFGCVCGNGPVMIGIVCICGVMANCDGPGMVGTVCDCGVVSAHGLVKGESMWVVIGHMCCLFRLYLRPCASNM